MTEHPNSQYESGKHNAWEHDMVVDIVEMQTVNIKNHFFREIDQNEFTIVKIKEALTIYARTVDKLFSQVVANLKPLDETDPEWKKQVGDETYAVMKNEFSNLTDGTFLAEILSDKFGIEPHEWLDGVRTPKLRIASVRIFQFTCAVVYCTKYNIDPTHLLN